MSMNRRATLICATVLSLAVVVTLIITAHSVTAQSDRKNVSGQVEIQAFSGPECTSPVGLCANVTFNGVLKGHGTFIVSSVTQTVDTPTTGVVLFTGDTLIETDKGQLTTKIAVLIRTTGAGEFSELDTIIGGTGRWQGTTGSLQVTGTFVDGVGSGKYTGSITLPN